MGVYGVIYGEARDPTVNTSVCDVVWPWWSLACGNVCHLYSHIRICYTLTLPLILLALFDPFHFSVCGEAEEAS